MNLNLTSMDEYVQFLQNTSVQIQKLCDEMGEELLIAVQCMDQQSGRQAARRMAQNIQNIKNNIIIADESVQKLVKAKTLTLQAMNTFGR